MTEISDRPQERDVDPAIRQRTLERIPAINGVPLAHHAATSGDLDKGSSSPI
jgi:hypothetical protein